MPGGEGDELAHPVAEEDLTRVEVRDPLRLVVLDDGAAAGEDAPGLGVALRVGQVPDHVLDDRLGGFEAEGCRIADVELEDRVSRCLHRLRLFEDGSPDVVEDVGQLRRLPEHVSLSLRMLPLPRYCPNPGGSDPAEARFEHLWPPRWTDVQTFALIRRLFPGALPAPARRPRTSDPAETKLRTVPPTSAAAVVRRSRPAVMRARRSPRQPPPSSPSAATTPPRCGDRPPGRSRSRSRPPLLRIEGRLRRGGPASRPP